MKTVPIQISELERLSLVFASGTTLRDKVKSLLSEHVERTAGRLERGSESREEAMQRLWMCRQMWPKVEWQLISWRGLKGRGRIFSPYRLDGNSALGGGRPITGYRVEEEAPEEVAP